MGRKKKETTPPEEGVTDYSFDNPELYYYTGRYVLYVSSSLDNTSFNALEGSNDLEKLKASAYEEAADSGRLVTIFDRKDNKDVFSFSVDGVD